MLEISSELINLDERALMMDLKTGDRVRLIATPPYLKTAEPIPMLRSADLVPLGEEGMLLSRAPSGDWRVKFERGAYLLESKYLEAV